MKKYLIILLSVFYINSYCQLRVDSDGDVGIGTPNPDAKLDVRKNGDVKAYICGTGNYKASLWTWNYSYAYGFGIDGNMGHIYGGLSSPYSIMTFNGYNGYVGIGRSPSYRLDVNGSIRVISTVYSSDIRLKNNVKNFDDVNKLQYLNPISYNFKSKFTESKCLKVDSTDLLLDKNSTRKRIHYGLSAQDVQKIFPDLVYADDEGILAIDYIAFVPMLIKAYNVQQEQIKELNKKIQSLENLFSQGKQKSYQKSASKSDSNSLTNTPNPVNDLTKINLSIPDKSKKAILNIFSPEGKLIKKTIITERGNVAIEFNASNLPTGIYAYSLIVDNKLIDSNKMLVK